MFSSPFGLVYWAAFSVGTAVAATFVSRDGLREGFYSFMVGVSVVTGGVAVGTFGWGLGSDLPGTLLEPPVFVQGLTIVFFICLFLRYGFMYSSSKRPREFFLLAAVLSGCAALLGVVRTFPPTEKGLFPVQCDVVLSALILGTVAHALILGHWYLVTPKLTLRPLIRLNTLALCFLYARAAWIVGMVLLYWNADPVPAGSFVFNLFSAFGFLFFARIALGLVLPIVIHNMTRVPLMYKQTQPATGLLYISSLFIVGGELGAMALTWKTGVPV